MDIIDILSKVDHTLLGVDSTWEQIQELCTDALRFQTASVCIPPVYVKRAKEFVGNDMAVCTVIGFPNGYATTALKVCETEDAVRNGADEIDMVIHVGALKSGDEAYLLREIRAVKNACGDHILKVIIETCLLTASEIIAMCRIVTTAGADYIKTSTGFSTGGATLEDVRLMLSNIGSNVKVKASGGIATIKDAEDFVQLGCLRLGTSRIVKILKAQEAEGHEL